MPLNALEQELQTLAKFKASHLDLLKNGVRIHRACGSEIADLILLVGAERIRLSKEFLSVSEKLCRMRPPSYRNSISRSYYAMYHAARGVAYVYKSGDDFENHNLLHNGIPNEFPNAEQWKNDLKDARLKRNEADYDPYPASELDFEQACKNQLSIARNFILESERYLRTKGCAI